MSQKGVIWVIITITKFQFKIICRSRVLDKNIPLWYIVPILPLPPRLPLLPPPRPIVVVLQLVRQLVHTMFISNICASFYLCLKENLV